MTERLEKPYGGRPSQSAPPPQRMHQTADPRLHSVELDALRGIAVLGVVMTHASARWDSLVTKPLNIPLLNIDVVHVLQQLGGAFGVALFFLLSGYLLAGTESKRASKGHYSLRAYALRRALRLVPAYYVALIVCLLLWPGTPTLTDTLLHLAFLQAFVPNYYDSVYNPAFWSLTSEVVFYALLPILVLKMRGLYSRLALFGALLMTSLGIQAYMSSMFIAGSASEAHTMYLLQFPLTHLWLFMVGVLLSVLVEHLREKTPVSPRPPVGFSLFLSSIVLFTLFLCVPFIRSPLVSTMFTEVLVILFFAAALLGSPILSRVLSWRLLAFVGMISYSLFLLHNTVLVVMRTQIFPMVRQLFRQLDGAEVWVAFAGYLGVILVVAVAIAYLSFRYIESPFLRYKPK